jgi:hypothetical protein
MSLATLIALLSPGAAQTQAQPGRELLDGLLLCAPAVNIAPLPRIPIVRSKSGQPQGSPLTGPAPSVDAAPVVLQGRPQEGAWLRASVASAGLSPLPDVAPIPGITSPPGGFAGN